MISSAPHSWRNWRWKLRNWRRWSLKSMNLKQKIKNKKKRSSPFSNKWTKGHRIQFSLSSLFIPVALTTATLPLPPPQCRSPVRIWDTWDTASNGLYLIPFSAISQCHFPSTRVKSIFKFSHLVYKFTNYQQNSIKSNVDVFFLLQVSRQRGSDASTLNHRPSISTFREMRNSTQ